MKKINVLSTFDGKDCGFVALKRAAIPVKKYFASEIDKAAIEVAMRNHPEIDQLGPIENIHYSCLGVEVDKFNGGVSTRFIGEDIDLLIGGSPCQSFSIAGDGSGFDGKSGLINEFFRLRREIMAENPKLLFLLENVKMKKHFQDIISKELGVEPIEINSSRVSGQNRARLYWTNIPGVSQPEDKGITLSSILEQFVPDKYNHSEAAINYMNRTVKGGRNHWDFAHHSDTNRDKSACVAANFRKGIPYNVLIDRRAGELVRRFTPTECERLQTLPDGYTEGVSDSSRYKMIGNGWTIDVVSHIFSFMKSETLSNLFP